MDKITLLVKELLKKNRINKYPIQLEKITKSLGILVKLSNLDDEISGFLYFKDGYPVIFVNQSHHPSRQRFTIAHEIGHLVLNHKGELFVDKQHILYRDSRSKEGNLRQEREANRFAAELLMPEEMILDEIIKNEINPEDQNQLEDLANKFGVSSQALTIRLSNLGWALF